MSSARSTSSRCRGGGGADGRRPLGHAGTAGNSSGLLVNYSYFAFPAIGAVSLSLGIFYSYVTARMGRYERETGELLLSPMSSTGYAGVYRKGNQFKAEGKSDGRKCYLGSYATALQAAQVFARWHQQGKPWPWPEALALARPPGPAGTVLGAELGDVESPGGCSADGVACRSKVYKTV